MTTNARIDQLDTPHTHAAESQERKLQTAGGAAAALIVVLLIAETVAYLATSAPSLADAEDWFRLFQTNRFVGLIDFGALELCAMVLYIPMFLALYTALRRSHSAYMSTAAVLAFAGIAANFATNKLFSLLTLSDLYAAAGSAALKAQFVAAGQATLALGALGGIGGSVEGGLPLAVAGLIISFIMLRSRTLGRGAGYVGLAANAIALAMYAWAAAAPVREGSPFFGPFLLLSVIWYALIARGLTRLARRNETF